MRPLQGVALAVHGALLEALGRHVGQGVDEEAARAIIATQLPMADKEKVATHVVRNDGDLDALESQVDRLWAALGG